MPAFTSEQIERSRRRRGKSSAIQAPAIQAPAAQSFSSFLSDEPDKAPPILGGFKDWFGSQMEKAGPHIAPVMETLGPHIARLVEAGKADPNLGVLFDPLTWRMLGTAVRGGETAVGTMFSGVPQVGLMADVLEETVGPGRLPFQPPSPRRIPEAAAAFAGGLGEEGDTLAKIDKAFSEYHDAMKAGWGYWGASGLAAEAAAAPGLAFGGRHLVKTAMKPDLLKSLGPLGRAIPETARPRAEDLLRTGLRGFGEAAQIPLELEMALGSAIAKPLRAIKEKFRPSPDAELVPPLTPDEVQVADDFLGPRPTPDPSVAKVPFMITRKMTAELKALGYSDEAINSMTPDDAWRLLGDAPRTTTAPVTGARAGMEAPTHAQLQDAISAMPEEELNEVIALVADDVFEVIGSNKSGWEVLWKAKGPFEGLHKLRRKVGSTGQRWPYKTKASGQQYARSFGVRKHLNAAPNVGQEFEEVFHALIRTGKFDVPTATTARPVTTEPTHFVGSSQPEVVRNVPPTTIVPDNQAAGIVSSADPSPPKSILDSTPEQAFEELANLASPLEIAAMAPSQFRTLLRKLDPTGRIAEAKARPMQIIRTIMRRHEAAINSAQNEAARIIKGGLRETDVGESRLRELGLSVGRGNREVIRESSIPEIDALYKALHGEGPVPERLRGLYDELRHLADFEEMARIDFDPDMAKVQDYFYRGWTRSKALIADQAKAQIGGTPKFKKPRKGASYQQMRDAGYEPLSWNPFEQWNISRMQGVRYRQQMALVAQLKKLGLWRPSGGATKEGVEGIINPGDGAIWRTPQIGPAFEGKPLTIVDDVLDETGIKTGEKILSEVRANRGVVHPEVARRLETMYGRSLPEGWGQVGPAGVDMAKVIDGLVFIPKRAKLFASFFQQIDFLFRNLFGTASHVIERALAGDFKGALQAGYRWPQSAYSMLKANLSPNYRVELKKVLGSTEAIVPERPGVNFKGIMEAGLSLRDVNIYPTDIGDIARLAADDAGVRGVKKIGDLIIQLESAMKNGLFDGVYPAAMISDIKNNVAAQMVRKWGHLSDAQINGAIAEFINIRYSTIPVSQTVMQNRHLRGVLQRVFFSIGESEGLLRQAAGFFVGPHAGMWRKHWLGAYLALMGVANVMHFASTKAQGKDGGFLPWERWTPVSEENWGPLPFSYNRDFAAPNLPWKGRGGVELTVDIVGQADTAFRLLDPVTFLNSRESVPVRALQNQLQGTDFYGAKITEAGPMGLYSRTASLINDMFAPIGIGQSLVGIARERIPAVAAILPPGEERIGVGGQITQAAGINVRAETTKAYKNRMARESGLINPDTGQPVRSWDELLPRQEQQVRQMVPRFEEELQRRTEILAERQNVYAKRSMEVQRYEDDLISKAQRVAETYLDVPITSGRWNAEAARKAIGKAEDIYYGELYGTIWSEEKQRFTGGVYDDDIDFEKPEENTTDYFLWQYRNLYQDARDRVTGEINFDGEAGELLQAAQSKFWAQPAMGKDQTRLVLENIRLRESTYPQSTQKMLHAGRYAQMYRGSVDGVPYTYWELETHPKVLNDIETKTNATRSEIIGYLDLNFSDRKARRVADVYNANAIEKQLRKSKAKGGELYGIRKRFIEKSPKEWMLGMMEAGFNYQGSERVTKGVIKQIREGRTMPDISYEELYKQQMVLR